MKIGRMFYDSFCELKSVKNLATAAMLMALSFCLGYFTIPVADVVQISFGFIAMGMLGALFGPFVAALCGGIIDVVGYMIHPTGSGFFLGFTLSAIVASLIYGLFLYKNKFGIVHVFLAMLTVGIVVNIGLNSVWLSMMYGYGFIGLLPTRIIKNCITVPLDTAIFYTLVKGLEQVLKRMSVKG